MKRLLAFCLACYVLSLVLTPCVDQLFTGQETTCVQYASGMDDSHSDHHDACSPFCTCSCCNVSMEVTSGFILPASSPDYNEIDMFVTPQVSDTFSPQIWQPPKA
jgi:hypothetical protein